VGVRELLLRVTEALIGAEEVQDCVKKEVAVSVADDFKLSEDVSLHVILSWVAGKAHTTTARRSVPGPSSHVPDGSSMRRTVSPTGEPDAKLQYDPL
jgi:hypothetical protein